MFQSLWQFVLNPNNAFLTHSWDYIRLCVLAVIIAIIIGVLLGILVSGLPALAFVAINLSGLMRAIPIIAFLAAVIPYLGIGFTPALVALTVLGIPPILLNTYTGLRGIDPATIDAARGMGMTRGQIISRIQIPLILPIVAAGVRTSAVQVVATATLGGVIASGGYGEYILSGLYQQDIVQVLAGAIPVAILALLIDVGLGRLQRVLTPRGLKVKSIFETT